MPFFDFTCEECGNNFDVMVSNADKHKVRCPECSSSSVKQLLSSFNTSRIGVRPGRNNSSEACQTCTNSGCKMKF